METYNEKQVKITCRKHAEKIIERLGHLGGHWGRRCELLAKELEKHYYAGVDIGDVEGFKEGMEEAACIAWDLYEMHDDENFCVYHEDVSQAIRRAIKNEGL